MKKLILVLFAIVALASCTPQKPQVVDNNAELDTLVVDTLANDSVID